MAKSAIFLGVVLIICLLTERSMAQTGNMMLGRKRGLQDVSDLSLRLIVTKIPKELQC